MNNSEEYVYRIFRKDEFNDFKALKKFKGNDLDSQSGFIHMSTSNQVDGTIARYFIKEKEIFIIKFKSAALGPLLRWEESRNSEFFPHFYGVLRFSWIKGIKKKNL